MSKAELASCQGVQEKAYRKDGACACAQKVEKVGETTNTVDSKTHGYESSSSKYKFRERIQTQTGPD